MTQNRMRYVFRTVQPYDHRSGHRLV